MKRKICDIWTWKKHLFLDISSTNIDTLVSSLCRCVETHSMESFWLLSQPLPHLLFNVFVSSETFATMVAISRPSCEPLYATNTSHHKQETFLYKYSLHWVLLPTRNVQQYAALRQYTPQARSSVSLLKPISQTAHACLLPELSCSCIMLLPCDTHRRPITSITVVLLPFVTYLLTPSYIMSLGPIDGLLHKSFRSVCVTVCVSPYRC
jgi:hypothetical protein